MKTIELPDPSLVMLIGASSSGKSTFARQHFPESSILSSDAFRAMVIDDENSLTVNEDAFDALHYVLEKRLKHMRLTVVDATNVQPHARQGLVRLAKKHHLFPVAIVLDTPLDMCLERNKTRSDRSIPEGSIRGHVRHVRRLSSKRLRKDGIRIAHWVSPGDDVEIERVPLYSDRKGLSGPFDIIGDVHGCFDELCELLGDLGYQVESGRVVDGPAGRQLLFLGDLVDRGPKTPEVLGLVMDAVDVGRALCVPGNHDVKLARSLRKGATTGKHGLDLSLAQLAARTSEFRGQVVEFIEGLVSHYVLDGGDLVVAHAGLREDYQGRSSGKVRAFALYGDVDGEFDADGLPVRNDWAADYRGRAAVVYGHMATARANWKNNTICIDTGCVFGGKLTALRWPERELVEVPARKVYSEPVRPLDKVPDADVLDPPM